METSTEKIIRLLLSCPKRRWRQTELASAADCSKAYLSKLTKRWLYEGMIARPKPQEIVLVGASKALSYWVSIRKPPKAVFISTNLTKAETEHLLKKETGYALTLFSAAWHRAKFMKTNTIEAYVLRKKLKHFVKKLGKVSGNPTPLTLMSAEKDVFINTERMHGLLLVSPAQNYVDLMLVGGSGVRVALEIAKMYNLLGV